MAKQSPYEYRIPFTESLPKPSGAWDGPVWDKIPALPIACFRPEGSRHYPKTNAKLTYNSEKISCIFQVQDQYTTCIHTTNQSPVCQDSCVECFVQPKPDYGYFNFEFNCGGTLLASYVTDPTRIGTGLKEYAYLSDREIEKIEIFASLPRKVHPEIQHPLTWYLEFSVPFSVFENYLGPLATIRGRQWKANFYKCGDRTSHPHWASWSPVDELNFHLPDCFGTVYMD